MILDAQNMNIVQNRSKDSEMMRFYVQFGK